MNEIARRRLSTAAKAVVAIASIAFIVWMVPLGKVFPLFRAIHPRDVVVLVVLTLAQVAIGVVRWKRVLARLGESVAYFPLFGDVLVGLTYNLILPTGIGGDVVRAYRARARVSRPHHAWSSSLYERIAGLVTMATTGAVAVVFGVGVTELPRTARIGAIVVAVAMIGGFFFASAPFRFLVHLFEKRLRGAKDEVRGIVDDLEGPLSRAPARLEALGWSILYQAFGVLFMIAGARALGATGVDAAIAIGGPIVLVLSIAPVSFGGHGFREGVFVGVFTALGLRKELAFAVALEWLASSALFAFAGGIVLLATPSSRAASLPPRVNGA